MRNTASILSTANVYSVVHLIITPDTMVTTYYDWLQLQLTTLNFLTFEPKHLNSNCSKPSHNHSKPVVRAQLPQSSNIAVIREKMSPLEGRKCVESTRMSCTQVCWQFQYQVWRLCEPSLLRDYCALALPYTGIRYCTQKLASLTG